MKNIDRIIGSAVYSCTVIIIVTVAVILVSVAMFGGSINIRINNPFWDRTEVEK
mgnify:CR=1 FL=1